jgi:hypothetical protein
MTLPYRTEQQTERCWVDQWAIGKVERSVGEMAENSAEWMEKRMVARWE